MDIKEYLKPDEIKQLTQKSDWKASLEVLKTWSVIGLTFLLVGLYPSIFTIIPALFILGGKQLACSIIMHDASHRALFKNPRLNDFVGNWLGGYFIFGDTNRYRPYHLKHHINAGTHKDPDLSLVKGYPSGLASFIRKIRRDLSGLTGLKSQLGTLYMNLGYIKYTAAGVIEKIDQSGRNWKDVFKSGVRYYHGPVIANGLLWGVLYLCGAGWLYLLWVGALLSTYNFSLRIRSIAEHSMVPDQLDPHKNTRTTYARWWEKILFAPHNVNYHAEHHLLMTVPPYNLARMHRLLKERGFYEEGVLAQNYWDVMKMAMSKKSPALGH